MGVITIVGLGPGAAEHLSLETMSILENSQQVILRTAVHPSVAELERRGVRYAACDDLYESGSSFEEVYAQVTERVLAAAAQGDVAYAVPGSPLVAEKTVALLREKAQEAKIKLHIKPSMSFLDLAYVRLGIDPIGGLRIIDACDFDALADAGSYPLLLTQVYSRLVASDVKIFLMENLPDDFQIYFLRNLGLADEECRPLPLFELDRQENIDHLTSVYIPPLAAGETEAFGADADDDFEDASDFSGDELPTASFADADIQPLADVIRILREPGGCPWDREQTHASIRSNMIEEVYEYLEAVDAGDFDGMREELGDVLMQVVFHARMAQEAGHFDLQDVIDEVTDKLIRRHPHVFGGTKVRGSDEVLVNWEAIKKTEKTERKHVLDGVSQGLPALLRAYKLQGKAAKAGFDWQEEAPVLAKVAEEIEELREALAQEDQQAAESELGDVLFALVNYARHHGIEPEVALNAANNRFSKRFAHVEARVEASGKKWQEFSLDELDGFWNEAKAAEKQEILQKSLQE